MRHAFQRGDGQELVFGYRADGQAQIA